VLRIIIIVVYPYRNRFFHRGRFSLFHENNGNSNTDYTQGDETNHEKLFSLWINMFKEYTRISDNTLRKSSQSAKN
jgi:hypothetical protein